MAERISSGLGLLYVALLGWGVGCGVYFSLNWLTLGDSAVFNYIAGRILAGAVPYRDISEVDFPGTYLLHMLFIIAGRNDFGFRLIDLFFCLMSGIGIFLIARRHSTLYALAGALLFTAIHLSWGDRSMLERDFLMVPFLIFAAENLKRWLENPQKNVQLLLLGVLAGYAMWIKPPAIIFILLAVFVIGFQPIALREKIRAMMYMALGGALPAILIIAWLYHIGALQAFYDTQRFFTLGAYTKFKLVSWGPAEIQTMLLTVFFVFCILSFMVRYTTLNHAEKIILTLGLIYGLLHFYGQNKGSWYHAYPFYGFISLYFAMVLPTMCCKLWARLPVYVLALAFCTPYLSMVPLMQEIAGDNEKLFSLAYADSAAEDVDSALKTIPAAISKPYLARYPGREVAFIGFKLWNVAYRKHWISPLRNIYPYPLYGTIPSPEMDRASAQMLEELATIQPLVIIIEGESWPYKGTLPYDAIDSREPWKPFFAEHYRLTKENNSYRVYTRIK